MITIVKILYSNTNCKSKQRHWHKLKKAMEQYPQNQTIWMHLWVKHRSAECIITCVIIRINTPVKANQSPFLAFYHSFATWWCTDHSLSPSLFLLQSLLQSISFPFCFLPAFAVKDTRPLEIPSLRKKTSVPPPPPSFSFITYYLCLTDLLQTNGCHMEKERRHGFRLRKEEGKPLSQWVPLERDFEISISFWACCVNISGCMESRLVPHRWQDVPAAHCLIRLKEE